jgi:AcrR family transcriptional regulator
MGARKANLLIGHSTARLPFMGQQRLREIKKAATRDALARAAFDLALECGLDGFVVDDVVSRAGYSRRTFANHYSCKEQAVVSVLFGGVVAATSGITESPKEMPPLDALEAVMRTQLSAERFAKLRSLVALSRRYPVLNPYLLAALGQIQDSARAALSQLANARYPDNYVPILLGAAYGSLSPLFDGDLDVLLPGQYSAGAAGAMDFDEFLDTVFGYLRNGF